MNKAKLNLFGRIPFILPKRIGNPVIKLLPSGMIEVVFGIIPVLCSGRNMVQTHLQVFIGRIPVMKTTMIGPDPTEMERVLPGGGEGYPPLRNVKL
jgi:hypothetical protein